MVLKKSLKNSFRDVVYDYPWIVLPLLSFIIFHFYEKGDLVS